MKTDLTTLTVTSPSGQILEASENPNSDISLSSAAGNHGSVSRVVWDAKLAQMLSMGFVSTTKTNAYNI
jgi:hypothetical protein